jgi:hypothetical protein
MDIQEIRRRGDSSYAALATEVMLLDTLHVVWS